LPDPGDVVVIDFPGVVVVKRRPTVVVSSPVYHAARPDIVVGLITSQTTAIGPTDYVLQDWAQAGLRVPSVFRSFFATLPSTTHPVVVGHLSDRDWQGVCGCLRIALASLSTKED
jgi:mRNA interferase MazF